MAQDLNSVTLIGNIVRDCGADQNSFAYLQSGAAVARVSIAVNRSRKQGEQWVDEVSYFDITIYGKTAENLRQYLLKGKKIAVSGHLQQDRWKDQQGNNRSRVSVVAETVQLLGGNPNGQQAQQQGFNPNTAYPTAQAAQQASNPQMYGQPQQQQMSQQPPQQMYQPAPAGQPDMGFPEDIPF